MLQKLLIVLFVLALAVSVMFFFKGKASQTGSAPGLVDGKLAECSTQPNCACSEYADDDTHFVAPIDISSKNPQQAFTQAKKAIEATGGKIVETKDNYVAATYTSKLFKFVDDVELRLDTAEQKIHIRSKSREGYSDMGVNAKRVAAIKKAM